MNKTEIIAFLNANPVFHLATVEGNRCNNEQHIF